jgi:hypothetical protein
MCVFTGIGTNIHLQIGAVFTAFGDRVHTLQTGIFLFTRLAISDNTDVT